MDARRRKKKCTKKISLFRKKHVISAAQFRIQGSVALHPGANTKIRANMAGEEKMRLVAYRLAAQSN
jgi:hypothetical protein